MIDDEIYDAWAPRDSWWSPWVKPVLFAHLRQFAEPAPAEDAPEVDFSWVHSGECVAIVVDLPGALGVWYGLALAARGFRPVPLYNAIPAPAGEAARVDVWPIVGALRACAPRLQSFVLPPSAPPAFLLDSNRRGGVASLAQFDNRSISFPTDFPSGNLLRSRGFERALLVQRDVGQPEADLRQTLWRWQAAGVVSSVVAAEGGGSQVTLAVSKPRWTSLALWRLGALLGLPRGALGGFGGRLGGAVG